MLSFLLTASFVLVAVLWALLGLYLFVNYGRIFGPHLDDPAETPGARSFGVTHIVAVWVGGMGLAIAAIIFRF